MTTDPQTARAALVAYAVTTRTVTVDGLDPLIDAVIAEASPAAPVAAPPTGQAGLRERIAAALYRHEWPGKQVWEQALAMDREAFLAQADAVLPVLPETARLHDEILTLRADQAKMRDLLRSENQRANSAIDRETTAEEAEEEHRLALSTALGLGTSAPWDAIRERGAELAQETRRLGLMVDEYGAGASALTDKLKRARDMHRETCIAAKGDVPPTAFTCGMCEALDAPAVVLPAPVDRAAVFAGVRPQTLTAIASHLDARAVAILRPDSETYTQWQTVIGELRRLAAETAGPETQARRGDEFEQWLKAQRDLCFDYATTWGVVDGLLDQYRLHADTGTPLSEHVCEGRVAGDCDCLEKPAFEADRDSKTSPKGDAKPVHARPGPDDNGISPCCARPPFEFRGERLTRDPAKVTCIAAAVTLPGKEA